MNKDGSDQKQLTFTEAAKSHLAVSPDDSKIAFISSKTGFQEIYTISVDGSNERKVTYLNSEKGNRFINGLEWKPDGRLSFAVNIGEIGRYWFRTSLYTMNPNGSDLQKSSTVKESILEPTWTPDGKKIFFRSSFNGVWDIFSNLFFFKN